MAKPARETIEALCKEGDVETLRQLADTNGAASVRLEDDPEKLTALHQAAAANALDAVKFLLSPSVGADPSAARGNNFTPLHAAAMFGHTAVCTVLLEAGAAVDVQTDPQGYAPLHSAAFAGHVATIRLLLDHGADRGLLNYRGERPADTANRQGQIKARQLPEVAPS